MKNQMGWEKILGLVILMGGCFINLTQADDSVKRPNILIITVDDLNTFLGCYGDTFAQTPNLDKLAETAFLFENNYCQQAVCSSARASLFTGKRPDYIMVWEMNTQIRNMISDIITMPQLFKENGYETAAIGKVFDTRSVDVWHDSLSWSIRYQEIERANPKGDGWVFAKETVSTEAPDVTDNFTLDGEILAKSLHQLDQFKLNESPFFLAIGFHKPHLPFVAPKKYWDLYDRDQILLAPFREHAEGTPDLVYETPWNLSDQYVDIQKKTLLTLEKQKELIHGYYACVSFIDQQIGILINHLKKKNLYENTIVVISSDHGMHLGDHGIWCKKTNLEKITRIPLIISYGSRFKGTASSPTELIDIFPTLCELTGINATSNLDGISLLPIMKGNKKSVKLFAVSQIQRPESYMGYAFRDERYRYIVWLKNDFRSYMPYQKELIVARELYDYRVDPYETKNMIDQKDYSSIVQKFENLSVNFFIDQAKTHVYGNQFIND